MQFLSVDEVVGVHDQIVAQYGGRPGVRDAGMLEASLYRPQTGCYDDLTSMAAAMFEALLFNHAFYDANHHIAFFATDVFLRLNGYRLNVDPAAATDFILALKHDDQAQRNALLPLIRRAIVPL